MKKLILALAIIVAASSVTTLMLSVGLRVVVNVPSRAFDINLVVDKESGVVLYDLGRVEIPNGSVIVEVALLEREGNFSIVVNGVLTLKSENRVYTINMPCAIVIGAPCFRIMMLIPGWDEPMPIEGGVYDVSLKLMWERASGEGKFHAKLHLIHIQR